MNIAFRVWNRFISLWDWQYSWNPWVRKLVAALAVILTAIIMLVVLNGCEPQKQAPGAPSHPLPAGNTSKVCRLIHDAISSNQLTGPDAQGYEVSIKLAASKSNVDRHVGRAIDEFYGLPPEQRTGDEIGKLGRACDDAGYTP